MFHIIGVSHHTHTIQKGGAESDSQKDFRTCLQNAIGQYRPVLVGEELNKYALQERTKASGTPQESLTKVVCDAAGVSHRFCDPDDKARTKMGYEEGYGLAQDMIMRGSFSNEEAFLRGRAIEVAKHWPRREKFWLEQLHDVATRDVIFVCGDAHIESFQKLLKQSGIDSDIVKRHIGVTPYDDQVRADTMAYLKEHPELLA